MTNEELLQKALARATAKGQKMVEQKKEKLHTDRKTILVNWETNRKKRLQAEHETRVKNGRELAESFIQEVADAYLRLTDTEEKITALQTLRINFIPGKSDQASISSVAIMDGSKRISTIYKASLQQLREKETRLLGKLQEQTGFQGSTPIEMMEEIARLQGNMGKDAKRVGELSPIVAAAQQLLLARADGADLEDALVNLEQTFLPPSKRNQQKPDQEQEESPQQETPSRSFSASPKPARE